ncbi:MAG: LytR/AlgR family response regulator transcription factor, partial [Saprospiraceae bacterium]
PVSIPHSRPFIFISKDRKQIKIYLENILFIESLKDYITIHATTEKHTIKYSITTFLKELNPQFLRIHRSFIINTDKITAYTKQDIEIGQKEIPIGETYKEEVERFLKK